MQYTIPHYFKKFQCTASACPDTCCAGWEIVIDEKTIKKYKRVKGSFRNRLHNSIDWKNAVFKQYRHRCEFLNEDNLCDIYKEAGPAMLCKTCRTYPRHVEEYEGLREISLSLSCPPCAELILGCKEKVRFITREKECPSEEYGDFDFLLFTNLMDARDAIIRIMQNRDLDCTIRMAMVLAFSHDLQSRIDRGQLYSIEEVVNRYQSPNAISFFQKKQKEYKKQNNNRGTVMNNMFHVFDQLEILRKEWPDFIDSLSGCLFAQGETAYSYNRHKFLENVEDQSNDLDNWACWCEQLMVYFIFTYFCGAVYDREAYSKMQLAVVSTLLIQEMAQALWLKQKEKLEFGDFIRTTQRYSREIEHSDLNLNRLEEIFTEDETFHLDNLLFCIFN
ncbi:flagellin lysine-N-methylase [uncultured Robinsoniella sp.]|uniref:flagellin lysine-N-methylase n=1 Tax=uncultured Robinsoniella sp. TaxID=904190 RepID=UPI00374F41F9